jgi:hypothetical protein
VAQLETALASEGEHVKTLLGQRDALAVRKVCPLSRPSIYAYLIFIYTPSPCARYQHHHFITATTT